VLLITILLAIRRSGHHEHHVDSRFESAPGRSAPCARSGLQREQVVRQFLFEALLLGLAAR